MEINTLKEQELLELFPDIKATPQPQPPAFGQEQESFDIFSGKAPGQEPPAGVEPKQEEAPNPDPNKDPKVEEPKEEGKEDEGIDILGEPKEKPGRKPKYDFTDASGYFEDRFKSGKFVAIEEEGEDGVKKPFIPKTPEEFDEVIDIQVNYRLDQEKKDLEKKIYSTKSPAWQAVLKYSEMTDDPTEIIPFIQGIQTIESVSSIDENEIDGAEQIVRTRLMQANQPEDIIETQIESLKTTDKLIETAKKLKPLIIQGEKQQLMAMKQQKELEEQQYNELVDNIRESAVKSIETPLFGKIKLKNDEKAAIYNLIAEPDPQSQGYPIYSRIDSLFEKGDFDTLKELALVLEKKEAYKNYISASAADKTAEGLQRKLRVATENRSSSTNDEDTDTGRTTVSRKQYNMAPRFGR